MTNCQHCRRRQLSKPRGLCNACYMTLDIRRLYAPSREHNPGLNFDTRTWPEPTDAAPGSLEKARILEERAASGQHLFHPGDATTNTWNVHLGLTG